jgi:hypothetical protein
VAALGKPVSVPCRANRTDAAAAEPSRVQENPVSVPCRANRTAAAAAAAEQSRDRGNL